MFFLLSIIGFASVTRFLGVLEKFFIINAVQKRRLMLFCLLPIYFFVFIKDLFLIFVIYIGVFLLSLTFFHIFFQKKVEKAYFKLHLHVVNIIILQIKAGYSSTKAIHDLFDDFNQFEKIAFQSLKQQIIQNFDAETTQNRFMKEYFDELTHIFKSQTKIIDQLETFKRGLMIKNRLYIKTKTILDQIAVQFMVCGGVYLILILLSVRFFRLLEHKALIFVSGSLFCAGAYLIYKLGRRVKWST